MTEVFNSLLGIVLTLCWIGMGCTGNVVSEEEEGSPQEELASSDVDDELQETVEENGRPDAHDGGGDVAIDGDDDQDDSFVQPTCNDDIQNQGEMGIDCGGPCPACTEVCRDIMNYSGCWADAGRVPCVLVFDNQSQTILTDRVFCNAGDGGKQCRFLRQPLTCLTASYNPVQAAVNYSSAQNQSLTSMRYEVFLEPGEFKIDQVAIPGQPPANPAQSPSAFRFQHWVGGQWYHNSFGGVYFGVQVPSYTAISGALVNNEQRSAVYIPFSSYQLFNRGIDADAPNAPCWSRGHCLGALFTLTNVLDPLDSNSLEVIQDQELLDRTIHDRSEADPVHDVLLQNLWLLGVGGPEAREQNVTLDRRRAVKLQEFDAVKRWPWFSYCQDPHCYYYYTVLHAIRGMRLGNNDPGAGVNVRIVGNKLELFQHFVKLGYFFNRSEEFFGDTNPLTNQLLAQLRVDGHPDSRIVIANNYMDGAIGADSVIVWGSYVDILNNVVTNGYNDWYGNQIALSVYTDAQHVLISGNVVRNYPIAVNLEGDILTYPSDFSNHDGYLLALGFNRVANQNVICNNQFENVMACMAIQRQVNMVAYHNTCSVDAARIFRLYDLATYGPDPDFPPGDPNYPYYLYRRLCFLVPSLCDLPEDQGMALARTFNTDVLGSGIHLRSGAWEIISDNTLSEVPRGIYMENRQWLPEGMAYNIIRQNNFVLSLDTLNLYRGQASNTGLVDRFRGVYWGWWANGDQSADNCFCTTNQFSVAWDPLFDVNVNNQYSFGSCSSTTAPFCDSWSPPAGCP